MLADNTYTTTLDRIEEGIAVILVEDDGDVVEERHIHDLERLPTEGRHEGAVLRVTIEENEIVSINYDSDTEEKRRQRLQSKFEQLSERPPDRDSLS